MIGTPIDESQTEDDESVIGTPIDESQTEDDESVIGTTVKESHSKSEKEKFLKKYLPNVNHKQIQICGSIYFELRRVMGIPVCVFKDPHPRYTPVLKSVEKQNKVISNNTNILENDPPGFLTSASACSNSFEMKEKIILIFFLFHITMKLK